MKATCSTMSNAISTTRLQAQAYFQPYEALSSSPAVRTIYPRRWSSGSICQQITRSCARQQGMLGKAGGPCQAIIGKYPITRKPVATHQPPHYHMYIITFSRNGRSSLLLFPTTFSGAYSDPLWVTDLPSKCSRSDDKANNSCPIGQKISKTRKLESAFTEAFDGELRLR